MSAPDKKAMKAEAKHAKKAAKLEHKSAKRPGTTVPATPGDAGPSPAVRYAEFVRGALSVVIGLSIIVALILGQRGAIISLNDIVENLFAAWTGKILLALIATGMVIYGLKYLRVVR